MTEATAIPIDGSDIEAGSPASDWQPLPERARLLFVLASTSSFALPATAAGFALGTFLGSPPLAGAGAGLLLGAGFGLWLGAKQFRHLHWLLDDSGLAIRRGRLWQRETRVPASRVQHLDLKRGPLQRRRALATLIVHTAGTRHSAVTVPNLDERDAERLRERLSRQIDGEG